MAAEGHAVSHPNWLISFWGVGTQSCADYVGADQGMKPGQEEMLPAFRNRPAFYSKGAVFHAWIQGFLSGAGLWMGLTETGGQKDNVSDALDGPDFAAVDLWIDNWCRSHPDRRISDAASAWITHVRKSRGLSAVPAG